MCKYPSVATVKPITGRWLVRLIQVIALLAPLPTTQVGIAQAEEADNNQQPSEAQTELPTAADKTDSELKKLWFARALVDRAKETVRTDLPYARELLNKAVDTVAEASGVDSFEYGQCLAKLGGIDLDLYRFKDALQELEKSRSILQRHRKEYDFHNLVAVDCNLATAYRKNGEFKTAERMYKDNLQEFHRESRLADIQYSLTLLATAALYLDMNELEKAFNYIHDAQDSAGAKSVGSEAVARDISSSLARYYSLKKDYPESNRYFQQALASFQRSDHPELCTYAEIVCGYSDSLMKQGKPSEAAAALSDKAHAIVKYIGRDHPLSREIQQRQESLKKLQKTSKEK